MNCSGYLESFWYAMSAPRYGNGHCTFRKEGSAPITIQEHEPIRKVCVLMVKS